MNDSLIYLLNVPELDVNNNNSFTFKNYDEQYNYFVSKIVKQVNGTKYIRKQKDSIKVNYSYNDCIKVNYAMINNDNKWLYFFIIDRIYVSEKVTNLILKLDVIQTYLFEFKFYDCFIERQHVDRWNSKGLPIVNLIEEGLEVGEYVVKNKTTLYDFNNKGAYIIASGDMIGNTSFGEGSSGGTSGGTGESGGTTSNNNSFTNYKVSKEMLACLKSYEGYFDYAYDLGDGTMTIGYGTTSAAHLSDYNSLVANCTEKKATEIMCKHLENNYAKGILDTMHTKGLKDSDIKQNHFDAFVDLAYNCGVYGATSSPMFEAYCNKKSANEVCKDWGTYYINAGTNVEQGLRNRRQKEINIFKNGTYQFTGITKNGNSKLDDNGGYGYIPDGYGSINNNSNTPSLKQRIVDSARKLIARPYVYGGNCPPLGTSTGTDCSGLCQWAYYDNGINIPRSTYQQINIGKEVSIGELQPADLVFSYFSAENTPEHVFIISKIENGTYYCVEAQQEGTNVLERTFIPDSTMRFRRVI